jgi:adenosylcobinamide amidohydrolase
MAERLATARNAVSNTAPAYLTVTVTPGNLGAGTYSGSIAIASSNTGQNIDVQVTMWQ